MPGGYRLIAFLILALLGALFLLRPDLACKVYTSFRSGKLRHGRPGGFVV